MQRSVVVMDAQLLIWRCCRRACVNGHDGVRIVREQWLLDISGQWEAVMSRTARDSACVSTVQHGRVG